MLAGSALLYGAGYAVFSVAAELRYYLWTMIALALALTIFVSDLINLPRRQGGTSGLIAIAPLTIAGLVVTVWTI